MRGAEAATYQVESTLTELFREIEEDISFETYTEADAEAAIRSQLGETAGNRWTDWKAKR